MRERLIRNNGAYTWVAPIHETLIEQRPTVKIEDRSVEIVHLSNLERMSKAIERNIRTLELSIYNTKGSDPRPTYYLGKAYFDYKDKPHFEIALGLMYAYLNGTKSHSFNNKSGWAEERAQCWEFISEIYRFYGEYNNAIKCCVNGMIEAETSPTLYLSLSLCYTLKGEWQRALNWLKTAISIPKPMTTLVINPKETAARAHEISYHANLNLSRLDEAWASAQTLAELFPENPEMQNRYRMTSELRNERELTKLVMEIAKYLKSSGQTQKLKPLLSAVPDEIVNNPYMVDLWKQTFPPRKWMDNEIAIFCGPGFTNWSPKLLENPNNSFVGGSEEAVIYLSAELAKLGWAVTVYADPGTDEGEYGGVKYQPYYKFNGLDEFNILVGWRNPKFALGGYNAKKLYIWNHDIQNPLDYTDDVVSKITKVIFLSPWHRKNVPNLPDEKVLLSSNGIML